MLPLALSPLGEGDADLRAPDAGSLGSGGLSLLPPLLDDGEGKRTVQG